MIHSPVKNVIRFAQTAVLWAELKTEPAFQYKSIGIPVKVQCSIRLLDDLDTFQYL